jgi:phasin family protein
MSDDTASSTENAISAFRTRIREIFDRFKLPGIDIESFIEARQADIDAVAKATSVALGGAQTITEKQADLLKSALGELNEALKSRSGESLSEVTTTEKDLLQNTLSRTFEGMKEMAEAAQKSQAEIFEIALERVRSNAEQLRGMFVADKG